MEFPPHSKNCKHNNYWSCQGMGLPLTCPHWWNTSGSTGVSTHGIPNSSHVHRGCKGRTRLWSQWSCSMKVAAVGLADAVHGSNKTSHQHWKSCASTHQCCWWSLSGPKGWKPAISLPAQIADLWHPDGAMWWINANSVLSVNISWAHHSGRTIRRAQFRPQQLELAIFFSLIIGFQHRSQKGFLCWPPNQTKRNQ